MGQHRSNKPRKKQRKKQERRMAKHYKEWADFMEKIDDPAPDEKKE